MDDRRVFLASKLRSVADGAPKDVVLSGQPANRMLLSLCSDFFEALFRFGRMRADALDAFDALGSTDALDLSDVAEEDVRTVVAYSEGRYEPTVGDMDALMRIQDRFLMPELRSRCEELLRDHLSEATWREVAAVAKSYRLWDLLAHAVIWASRMPWSSIAHATGFASVLWEGAPAAPASCVAQVLRCADFVSISHKFEVAAAWARVYSGGGSDVVFDVLRADLLPSGEPSPVASPRLWPGEVQRILEFEDVLPKAVLAALARAAAAAASAVESGRRRIAHHAGSLASELRRNMAKVDASIVASHGPGAYQMIVMPSTLQMDEAYFSSEVLLGSPPASPPEYHVYLNEEERLDSWWRRHSRPLMAVMVRHRAPGAA